jgi:anti-sigma factor RsiW
MTREELEFQISLYLDGGLPVEERSILERELASNPEAKAFFDEMRLIDEALKTSMALPPIRWDRLAESISSAVAYQDAQVRGGTMKLWPVSEVLEETIVRQVEGDLSSQQLTELNTHLASNAAAREALAQHQALDTVLKHGWPLPFFNWQRLQEHLSKVVAEADEAQPVVIRIPNLFTRVARLAIAAMVLITLSVGAWIATHHTSPIAKNPVQPKGTVDVAVLVDNDGDGIAKPETSAPAIADISFGPSDDYAKDHYDRYGSGGVVALRSSVQLSQTATASRIGAFLPY